LAEVEAPELKKRLAEAESRLAKLEKGPDPEVMNAPPTGGKEFTARETKSRSSTQAQWNARMASLDERIDNGDLSARDEKYRVQLQRRKGEVTVKD
jgi:hypothetical protein